MVDMDKTSLLDYIVNDSWNDRCIPTDQSSYNYSMAEFLYGEDLKPFIAKRESPDYETYHPCNMCPQSGGSRLPATAHRLQEAQYTFSAPPIRESTKPVEFFNVKTVYEKIQCRKNKQSKQRLAGATIDMMATFSQQIHQVEVYVQRCTKAAVLCGDNNGEVPLKPKIQTCHLTDTFQWQQFFTVDLDSVYLSHKGTPVYKLSTVDSDRRNRFRLVVYVTFVDGTRSRPYYSEYFLLRSKRSRPTCPYER